MCSKFEFKERMSPLAIQNINQKEHNELQRIDAIIFIDVSQINAVAQCYRYNPPDGKIS